MNDISLILSGALVTACALVGLVFLRFWKSSRDRLFVYFALSFWLQGVQWLLSALETRSSEFVPWQYLLRLFAYGLIAFAILSRNLSSAPRSGDS